MKGLQRLEYRGYDSAGLAVDEDNTRNIVIIKTKVNKKRNKSEMILKIVY